MTLPHRRDVEMSRLCKHSNKKNQVKSGDLLLSVSIGLNNSLLNADICIHNVRFS